ncbi:MFS transporter [Iodidimonas muriae]|uniref:MFS transporter n=1 Tax=Iodidimonas muriae TaxID=261467 RepID=A0ABQ2L9T4_9PROT|nr:transcription antitermination factor NusB [Iodidimonas muriae]GER06046.1 MFS transporter [Kordiimonadales bacterium JCM 17843]GGO08024.1 MFS transporter [Iodidimonas muriae]
MTDSLAPRRFALAILDHVLNRHQTLDGAVDQALKTWPMIGLDRSFARVIATKALRNLGFIDHVLADFLTQGVPDKCRYADLVLRGGLAQILFMDVPDHAAVDSSVRLIAGAKHRADRGMKPVVNAVLRRAVRERDSLLAQLDANPGLALPRWLADRWQKAYGAETLSDMARVIIADPPLDLSLRDPHEQEALAKALKGVCLPTGSVRLTKLSDVTALEGFDEGRLWVQDAAASLPARLLPEGDAIDFCAAPGGKSLQLAAQGRHVIALDRSARRLARLRENLIRTGLDAEIVVSDALNWTPKQAPKRVLLDAPCSATGTLRRHPDTGWLKSPVDVEKLADLQSKLLDHVAGIMADDGVMVYCVCSLEPEEGEDQVRAFLQRRPDFERMAITPDELPGLDMALNKDGDVRTLPSHWADQGGLDGFFIARFRKIA